MPDEIPGGRTFAITKSYSRAEELAEGLMMQLAVAGFQTVQMDDRDTHWVIVGADLEDDDLDDDELLEDFGSDELSEDQAPPVGLNIELLERAMGQGTLRAPVEELAVPTPTRAARQDDPGIKAGERPAPTRRTNGQPPRQRRPQP